jgi:hypothetical protein
MSSANREFSRCDDGGHRRTVALMPRPDLNARAEAIRAEAQSARRGARDAFFKQRAELELERERVAVAKDAAEFAAKQATERAEGADSAARAHAKDAAELDREAEQAAKRGDAHEAEEAGELADYTRRGREGDMARERQGTLDAATFREQATAHDRRVKELDYEIKALNSRNSAAEQSLDQLDDQARLYDEAARRFAAAEATDNIPERAQFELEAEAAVAKARAIVVDRAPIRVFVPQLPETTPGLDAQPSGSPAELDADSAPGSSPEADDVLLGDLDTVDDLRTAGAEPSVADVGGGDLDTADDLRADVAESSAADVGLDTFSAEASGDALDDAIGVDGTPAGIESPGFSEPFEPAIDQTTYESPGALAEPDSSANFVPESFDG